MLKKSVKDNSGKLLAVAAVLDQLSLDTLKSSNETALKKFHALVQHWAELTANELAQRREKDR